MCKGPRVGGQEADQYGKSGEGRGSVRSGKAHFGALFLLSQ